MSSDTPCTVCGCHHTPSPSRPFGAGFYCADRRGADGLTAECEAEHWYPHPEMAVAAMVVSALRFADWGAAHSEPQYAAGMRATAEEIREARNHSTIENMIGRRFTVYVPDSEGAEPHELGDYYTTTYSEVKA